MREDYSQDGEAWTSFSHDQARSRVYRWSEDGLGGICDTDQRLCLAFAFWNGQDPILKERIFGLTSNEGNHGEDAKEHWWYVDSTPTHSWMRWRYVYPQRAFPYEDLVTENARRGFGDPEYELLDTDAMADDRYWDIEVDYAKAGPDDLCLRMRVRNAGPDDASCTCSRPCGSATGGRGATARAPVIREDDGALVASDGEVTMTLAGDGDARAAVLQQRDEHAAPLGPARPAVSEGRHQRPRRVRRADRRPRPHRDEVGPVVPAGGGRRADGRGAAAAGRGERGVGKGWESTLRDRAAEADAFYAELAPAATPDEHDVMRQAFGGMLWSKQFYHYDVDRWLRGDPATRPRRRALEGRNAAWRHVDNRDVISMPDKWEYPWYAAWDLAFHCITLAHVDAEFAKEQLRLMTREWFMHPNGQLPAYEWNFGDVNPPVHALAALAVFRLDGARDREWLGRIFHKLLLGFTWWANVKDPEGNLLFGGGFLGMDNVGPFDRSAPLPDGLVLEQADGTGWMAIYCLSMLEIAIVLAAEDPAYEDVAVKFFEHFTMISQAINEHGLWDEEDGFYYDRVRRPPTAPACRCGSGR